MTKPTSTRASFARRTPVWMVLLVWMLALGAPCAHCIAQGFAAPAPSSAAAQLSAEEEAMLAGMPADCPMHKALAAKAKAPSSDEKEPCDQPADCCLERGAMPAAEEDVVPAPSAPSEASFAPVAALAVFAPPASPGAAGEPRFERSHAPPAFSLPLRT
jgi:hypothetical protein